MEISASGMHLRISLESIKGFYDRHVPTKQIIRRNFQSICKCNKHVKRRFASTLLIALVTAKSKPDGIGKSLLSKLTFHTSGTKLFAKSHNYSPQSY